jgi:hypothetical protein
VCVRVCVQMMVLNGCCSERKGKGRSVFGFCAT